MTWILLAALFDAGSGLTHLTFEKLFHWQTELKSLSEDNKGIVRALNLCLTFFFFLAAYLFFFFAREIHNTSIGQAFTYGMALFWIARTIMQLLMFNLKKPLHQVLLVLFIVGAALHFVAA